MVPVEREKETADTKRYTLGNERYTASRKRYTARNKRYNVACKEVAFWVQRVCHVYLKKSTWWDYKCLVDSSWVWRQIMKVKEILRSGFNSNNGKLRVAKSGVYFVGSGYNWLVGSLATYN